MKIEGGSTPNALLGLLSLRPMSGYDIRQMVAQSIGHFWSESYGQIYPGLKRLAAAGLIEKKTERNKGKPDRNLYSLTAEGRERLQEWLKIPVSEEVARNELLLKLFFGAHVSTSVNREHVISNMEFHQRALKVYTATAKQLRRDEANDPNLPYWLMTLNYGRHYSIAMSKWCRETLAELDEIESKEKRRR
ncbi:PadR family transcriptional regulator [Tunturiibacter gelidoferens]|uniref:DNA-binding PadR family transcriptional regulator n=1 Tax=Tunturiibacter gelidiferens TaxID=3069689 RepID=A0ACC5NWX5_9BACT|nr:PadR family transcriptional regulator [Edaphobacter lichenicola]MBB5339072.1 DNA-binding PadR family transcriptional regulator [Edaphobacter lichenicola]